MTSLLAPRLDSGRSQKMLESGANMIMNDPVSVLRSVSRLVRPGGVLAFQEVSYAPLLLLSAHLPLWSTAASLIRETFRRSGANTEIGLALYRIFKEAGLPAPAMRMEIPL